jgi:cysteine-rich repeat protein
LVANQRAKFRFAQKTIAWYAPPQRGDLMRNIFWFSALTFLSCTNETQPTQLNRAIVGGVVEPGHPYVVAVGSSNSAFCTGTLISARTVITAGHCSGGISNVFFGPDLSNVTAVPVIEDIRHPGFGTTGNFDPFFATNDLAVLRLAFDAPVQPAPLLRSTMTNTPEFIGPDYTFVGYGNDDGVNQSGFGVKRVVTFPIDVVGPANVGGSLGTIDDTAFFFAQTGENTCNGDSGGPAFFIQNGVETHAGATSSGDNECLEDGDQARTDAPQIEAFIQPHIDEFEADNPCKNDGTCNEDCNIGGEVLDPDCHKNHCGADNLCALSCAAPVDPDCNLGNEVCITNGLCGPDCNNFDDDCAPLCAQEGHCIPDCQTPDPDCDNATCGDGILQPGEECDDGNTADGDSCLADCTKSCGNGALEPGEQCDDGNLLNEDDCRNNCFLPFCGDGILDPTEECDDDNANPTDDCIDCRAAVCGDGFVQDDVEQCDDGNLLDDDFCRSNCVRARCGDGILDPLLEECDDGNGRIGDGCNSVCVIEPAPEGCSVNPTAKGSWLLLLLAAIGLSRRRLLLRR